MKRKPFLSGTAPFTGMHTEGDSFLLSPCLHIQSKRQIIAALKTNSAWICASLQCCLYLRIMLVNVPILHVHVYFPSTDPPHKVRRVSDSQSSSFCGQEPRPSLPPSQSHPSTPSRHSAAIGLDSSCARWRHNQDSNGAKISLSATRELMGNEQGVSSPYCASLSPPSPPRSPPLSPPLSPHRHTSPKSSVMGSQKVCSREGRISAGSSPYKTTPNKTSLKTPTKQGDPTTPSSTSKYRQALDLSIALSPKLAKVSILERFDAVYQSLTSQPKEEEEEGRADDWDEELQGEVSSPVLERLSGSRSKGASLSSSTVLTRAPAGPYVTVTGSDGSRVYLKLRQQKVSQ